MKMILVYLFECRTFACASLYFCSNIVVPFLPSTCCSAAVYLCCSGGRTESDHLQQDRGDADGHCAC